MPMFELPGLDGSLPSLGFRPRSPTRMPLPPEQEQSFGRDLLERSKGALGTVLGVLDWPGSKVRGVLAGRPGESVTGRQLLDRWGVTNPGDNGWGSYGLALGADVATDPLTYASFGAKHALTSGGRALERAGHLKGWKRRDLLEGYHGTESSLLHAGNSPERISHLRDAGRRIASPAEEALYQGATGQALRPGASLSGLARASVPFRPDLGVTGFSGKLAQRVSGALDATADFLKFGNPISRSLNGLFDWRVGRATDELSQRAISGAVPFRKELESAARTHEYETLSALDSLIREHPQHEANILRAARIGTEGTSPLAFLGSAPDPATQALYRDFLARTSGLGDTIAGYGVKQFEHGQRAGLRTANASDEFARYVSRQSTAADLAGVGSQFERRTILPTGAGHNVHREEIFRNLPGGTDRINDWANRYAGNVDHQAVASGILADIVEDYKHLRGGVPPDPARLLQFEGQALKLARRLGGLEGGKYLGKIAEHPFFSHDIAGDVARRGMGHARTMASANALVKALGMGAHQVGDPRLGADYMLLPQALKRLKLGNHDLGTELVGAGPELYRSLAPKGAGMVGPLTQGGVPYGLNKELSQWAIPRNRFDQIAKSYAGWVLPTEATAPVKFVDSLTNSFKALAYPIWAASHVRNAATAALNNLRTGTGFQDYLKQFRLMRGQLTAGSADALRRAQYGHARIFGEGGPNLELAGQAASAAAPTSRRWSGYAPGTNEHGLGRMGPTGSFLGDAANLIGNEGVAQFGRDVVAKARDFKNAPNPFGLSGVAGRTHDVFAPVAAGRKIGSNIEDFFRGAQYNGLVRQGYSPEMASELIRKYHFDYKDLAPFERNVMRRVMPFYTFSRKNLPLQLETLATRPGAFSTPFKPAMVDRDKQEYVPEYLANSFTMPLGPEQDGKRRFLSSLGLPQEEALKEMTLWNGLPDVSGTLMRYMGNLNPLIKGPLEQMTDTQFYSGRKLSDLRSSNTARGLLGLLGGEYQQGPIAQTMTQAISNTPLTRFATSLDKLLDTQGVTSEGRKPGWATALNLLTGARITDADLDAQRYFEERNALQRSMSGQPHLSQYRQFYARPDNRKLLTPQETMLLRMQTEMEQQAREHMERVRRQHPSGG